jgi:protocatechuate 3,4-dioxygenase beta subunit
LREPLSISDGAEISNVRIILSPDVATLTGRVLSSDGAPVRNAGVFLITANAEARQSTLGSRLFGRTNSEGIFTINGAPGEYQVLILRPGDRLLKADDDSIKPYIASPQRITLQPNERKNIDIIAPGSK